MYKLSLLTLAVMTAAGLLVTDPDIGTADATRPAVTREASSSFLYGFGGMRPAVEPSTGPTEEEAVRIAMAAGDDLRAARDGAAEPATRTLEAMFSSQHEQGQVPEGAWEVSGTWVNLRSGPGTSHSVVTQAGLGDMVEPLSDPAADWINVRLADGRTAWIYGKYLRPRG